MCTMTLNACLSVILWFLWMGFNGHVLDGLTSEKLKIRMLKYSQRSEH